MYFIFRNPEISGIYTIFTPIGAGKCAEAEKSHIKPMEKAVPEKTGLPFFHWREHLGEIIFSQASMLLLWNIT